MVSFFTDVSSEMIVPLLPVFLGSFGAGAFALGWVEGLADAVSSALKLLAGRWTDRTGRRVPVVIAGYGIASIARPLFALATSAWHVVLFRCIDRVGKGLRSSPRDALIAHSVPAGSRGAAFGFHRSMDHAGATFGPLLALLLIRGAGVELRTLFLLAAIPGAISVLVVWRGVRETFVAPDEEEASAAPRPRPMLVWRFLLPLGLFTLGKASDLFLMQVLFDRTRGDGPAGASDEITQLSLAWIGMHLLRTLAAYPGGKLADRHGRRRTIVLGWLSYAAACVGLAFARSQAALFVCFAVWAVQDGLTDGAQRALVSELAPRRDQGAAFGWYYLTLGLLALVASVLFGTLYEHAGRSAAFSTSAALAILGSGGLLWASLAARYAKARPSSS